MLWTQGVCVQCSTNLQQVGSQSEMFSLTRLHPSQHRCMGKDKCWQTSLHHLSALVLKWDHHKYLKERAIVSIRLKHIQQFKKKFTNRFIHSGWKCNSLGFWIPPKSHGSPSLGGVNIPYTENRQFITPAVTSTTNQIPIDSASHTVQCTSIFLSTLQRSYFQVSLEKGRCS
jgi:hypothetical protein